MVLRFLIHRATIPFDTCSRLRRSVLFVADSGAFLLFGITTFPEKQKALDF